MAFFHSNIGVVAFSPLTEFFVMLLNFNLLRYLMSPFRWKILRLLEAVALLFFLMGNLSVLDYSQSLSCLLWSHVSPIFLLLPLECTCAYWHVFEWESLPLVSASAKQGPLFWEAIYFILTQRRTLLDFSLFLIYCHKDPKGPLHDSMWCTDYIVTSIQVVGGKKKLLSSSFRSLSQYWLCYRVMRAILTHLEAQPFALVGADSFERSDP